MKATLLNRVLACLLACVNASLGVGRLAAAEVRGVTVTPHVVASSMKYRRPRDPALGARVKLFVKGSALPGTVGGKTPAEHLKAGDWGWHDFHTAIQGPDESLSVWTWNGNATSWGVGNHVEVRGDGLAPTSVSIEAPRRWISNVTFPGAESDPKPREMIVHVRNASERDLTITAVRLWLPKDNKTWQTLFATDVKSVNSKAPAGERAVVHVRYAAALPLTYAAVELVTNDGSLWEHLRIKRDTFDISGGWIGDHLRHEPYLRLLSQLHVNCGQIEGVDGYTNNRELYERYPFKLFNRLQPLSEWDTDEWLPKIHAVEFLGEPQYGGGRPVAPQEVFEAFMPYRGSRLATSVTHSEERIWRYYAGLSDFPHYDAYRVVAPAADLWRDYDRWDGQRISWGAPLETIGDMCRSLRELNRPLPTAYWSQGPHDGWSGGFRLFGRSRRSPTPDELRAQAMHALSTRITSLYWFNLSLKSLLKFPDTWTPITRVGREIRMLAPLYLAGDAHEFQRVTTEGGNPDWDCASIVSADGALLFANDLAYAPDAVEQTFRFGEPRAFSHEFALPYWLRNPVDVFRVDADGIRPVEWSATDSGVRIQHSFSRDAVFVATRVVDLRKQIEDRRQAAIDWENRNPVDLDALRALLNGAKKQ
jgi:hypothetical protein